MSKLVFHRHGFGVDGFLSGDAFESGEDAAVIILIALHGEAAFFVAVGPDQSDVVLLGFAESYQRADAEREHSHGNGSADTAVDILPVTDFGDCGGGNFGEFAIVLHQADLIGVDEQLHADAGFEVGKRSAVVCNFVGVVPGEHRDRHGDA